MAWNALSGGWENDGDSGRWKAEHPVKISKYQTENSGQYVDNTTMVSVVNPTTGAYDVYVKGTLGTRQGVYSYSPATGESKPLGDGTVFKRAFEGKAGQAQLNNLNTNIKKANLQNLKNHATDPIAQRDLKAISKTKGYQSLANTAEESEDDTIDDGGGGGGNNGTDDPANGGGDNTNDIYRGGESAKGTRDSNFGHYRFPSDLGNSTMDVIKFNMVKFNPRKFTSASEGLSGLKDRAKGTIIGSVTLPIPGGIQENNSVAFGDGNMTPLQAAGAKLMDAAFGKTGGLAAAGDVASKTFEDLLKDNSSRSAIEAYFTGQGIGLSVDQVLARTRGVVVNNNLELLFQGPVLRPFNFTFRLSPREDPEAQEIRRIIRFFKQGMAPQRSQGNLFLKAPHMFEIEYITRGEKGVKHPSLNSFKTCACIGFAVNYTPDGTYNTFDDPGASMTAYDLRMQFKELDPVYNEDYGNEGNLPADAGSFVKNGN